MIIFLLVQGRIIPQAKRRNLLKYINVSVGFINKPARGIADESGHPACQVKEANVISPQPNLLKCLVGEVFR